MNEDIQFKLMRLIFSTNEDVEYEQGTSSGFEKGSHYSKMFLNKPLLSLGYQLKIFNSLWNAAKTN